MSSEQKPEGDGMDQANPAVKTTHQGIHKFKDSEAKISLGQFRNSKEWEDMRSGSWQAQRLTQADFHAVAVQL